MKEISLWGMVSVTKQKPETRTEEISMTMVRHSSLFSQLVGFFHRYKFHSLVKKHQAEKYSKGFKSWDHFVSMLFCQLAQAKSLREISSGLACCMGKLRHLGMENLRANPHCRTPTRSVPGSCIRICFIRPSNSVRKQLPANISSGLKINCCLWTARPSPCA